MEPSAAPPLLLLRGRRRVSTTRGEGGGEEGGEWGPLLRGGGGRSKGREEGEIPETGRLSEEEMPGVVWWKLQGSKGEGWRRRGLYWRGTMALTWMVRVNMGDFQSKSFYLQGDFFSLPPLNLAKSQD